MSIRHLPLAALPLLAVGLALTTACKVVEPAPMAHTEDIPIKRQSVAGLLYGAHATIACEACHIDQPPPYEAVDDNCMGCHRADRRTLHPLGNDHEPDAKTCGGSGCHSVAHDDWGDWILGTEPPDTNDTGPTEPTNCWLPGPVVNDGTCASVCHGETNGYNPAPDDASHRAHTVVEDAQLWNLVDSSSLSTDNCSVCHPAGGQGAPTHDNCETDVVMQGIPPEYTTLVWPGHDPGTATTGTTGTTGTSTADTGTGGGLDPIPGPLPPAAYDPSTNTCSNVYCHGAGFFEAKPDPVWGDPAYGECGSCHSVPPVYEVSTVGDHPTSTGCGLCHGGTAIDATGISAKPLHIDGILTVD
jgi:predicted CxxxxCH...CXXCH cytochrome family protein